MHGAIPPFPQCDRVMLNLAQDSSSWRELGQSQG